MKGKHFAISEKMKKRTKSIVLSVVALLELLLVVTSVTFSWFEGITSLEIKGDDFKTASVLNSHIEVGENKTATDGSYNEVINLSSFFDAQKEVRLTPVSSADAKTFYSAYEGVAGTANAKYRKLSKADVNTNIIQFEFNISAPDGATDFYLTEALPIVKINDTGYDITKGQSFPYRFAFSDGSSTVILKNSDCMDTSEDKLVAKQKAISSLNNDDTAITVAGTVSRSQEYAYYTDHRIDVEAPGEMGFPAETPAAIKPLFHIDKGQTKTITVSVWLEAFDYECINNTQYKPNPGDKVSFDIRLCSTWSITREITVYDYTAEQWIKDADDNRPTCLFVRNADGDDNNRQYQLTYDLANHKWTGTIPIALQNCEFLWGKVDNNKKLTDIWATFNAINRGNDNTITMLGTDEACVWGLKPEELVKIDFRDYTDTAWIANKDDLGNDIDIIVEIPYDGRYLNYSMTGTPTQDTFGKNSWSCWIPKTVNSVDFFRKGFNSENNYVNFNTWHGDDRNGETVYRATGGNGGTTGGTTDGPFTLYVKIDDAVADTFYNYNRGKNPAISFTGNANRTLWETTSNKTTISRYDYHPNQDTWPNGESELTRVDNTNTWYMTFDEKPAPGTYVTVWSRSGANNFNDVDGDMCFGVFYLFDATKNYNTITITAAQKLTSNGASNNYALLGTMSSDGSGAGSNVNPEGDIGTGEWGELKAPDPSTWRNPTTFVHTANVNSVKVTFTWNNVEYTMVMEKDSTDATGRTWNTRAIPDSGVTNIKFSDNNGKTWTAPTSPSRTNNRHYLYATNTNGGCYGWTSEIDVSSDTTYVFKHYDTSATSVTVSYLSEEGVPFTFNLIKGSDNKTWRTDNNLPDGATSVKYSDGTHTWTIGDNNSDTPYCYAVGKSKFELSNDSGLIRVYMTDNMNWGSNCRVHFWGGSSNTGWPGNAMKHIATNNSNQKVYYALIPSGTTGIVFNNNDQGQQTKNITSNIGDLKGWWLSGSNQYTANAWTVDAAFLNAYSQ